MKRMGGLVACDLIPYPLLLKEKGDAAETGKLVGCAVRTMNNRDGAHSAPYEGNRSVASPFSFRRRG